MNIRMTLFNYNRTRKMLDQAGFFIPNDFKGEILTHGKRLREKAQQNLKERATAGYWTGTLHDAIVSEPIEREGAIVGVTIRADARRMKKPGYLRRKPEDIDYSEWVEVGHTKRDGSWWKGYQFMEDAFVELAPQIPGQIAQSLKGTLSRFSVIHGRGGSRITDAKGKIRAGTSAFAIVD